jgi:hypothetical protein
MNFENSVGSEITRKYIERLSLWEIGRCGTRLWMVLSLTIRGGEASVVKVRQLHKTSNIVGRTYVAVKL